jgi:transketolase
MTTSSETRDLREAAVDALVKGVEKDLDIVVLVSDSTSTASIGPFKERFPRRLVNVGIAEQNLLGIAAGLSRGGFIAVTANAACFLVSRSCEQLKTDVCYSDTNVKLLGLNAGVAYGPLASTHHAINDIAVMRSMGNILIFAPCDAVEAFGAVTAALSHVGPVYVRLDNAKLPVFHAPDYRFSPGAVDLLAPGADVMIFAMGSVVQEAMNAREMLSQEGVSAGVANVSSLRPVDRNEIVRLARSSGAVITVEEHSLCGGLGSLVSETLAECGAGVKIVRLGFPEGEFAKCGPRSEIRKHYGIDSDGIRRSALRMSEKKGTPCRET